VKIAHLADLHLGFRQYHRQTPAGVNQREADVAAAFRHAVDGVLAAGPDAVIIAGDLFHAVRPSNRSIVYAFRQLQRLREGLPRAPILLIAGNHDTPRSSDTGSILRLYEELGVDLATDEARRFTYPGLGLSVLAMPHASLIAPDRTPAHPDGPEPHQVLVMHGAMPEQFPGDYASVEYGGAMLDRLELAREHWSYVALGHYHVQHEVLPRVWYCGSLDYASANPWGELADERRLKVSGKAWLLADLDAGTVTRMPVPEVRRVVDLKWIDATDQTAAGLDFAIAASLASVPGGLDDAVVRLVVQKIPRHLMLELDHAAIRAAKARALHLHLDFRRLTPERLALTGGAGTRQTLPDLVRDYLSRRPLPERLSRERFVGLGLDVLAEPDSAAPGDGY
jgi:DNA repair exonuclease SbcCD nuclease subunit